MIKIFSITALVILAITSCSDEGNSQEKHDHVWKEQTQTLDKAKAVEGIIMDSAEAQKRQIQKDSE